VVYRNLFCTRSRLMVIAKSTCRMDRADHSGRGACRIGPGSDGGFRAERPLVTGCDPATTVIPGQVAPMPKPNTAPPDKCHPSIPWCDCARRPAWAVRPNRRKDGEPEKGHGHRAAHHQEEGGIPEQHTLMNRRVSAERTDRQQECEDAADSEYPRPAAAAHSAPPGHHGRPSPSSRGCPESSRRGAQGASGCGYRGQKSRPAAQLSGVASGATEPCGSG
jgi:hypothetical protein